MTVPATDPEPIRRHPLRRYWIVSIGVVALILAGQGTLDRQSSVYIDAGLQRALASFALARGLNAAISVAQGTEIAVQPAGVGLVLTPGEILDPINDLVERFSWVMLLAGASLGIQKLLLMVAAHQLLLAVLVVLLTALVWVQVRSAPNPGLRVGLERAVLVLLLVRFAVPAMALTNQLVHELVLADEYQQAGQQLDSVTQRLGQLKDEAQSTETEPGDGMLEEVRRWYRSAVSGVDIEARLRHYETVAAGAVDSAIRLISLFLFQTIVLPLVFLWVLLTLGRHLFRRWS